MSGNEDTAQVSNEVQILGGQHVLDQYLAEGGTGEGVAVDQPHPTAMTHQAEEALGEGGAQLVLAASRLVAIEADEELSPRLVTAGAVEFPFAPVITQHVRRVAHAHVVLPVEDVPSAGALPHVSQQLILRLNGDFGVGLLQGGLDRHPILMRNEAITAGDVEAHIAQRAQRVLSPGQATQLRRADVVQACQQ